MTTAAHIGIAFGNVIIALIGAPLLLGIINKVKAFFAGRQGPPVRQLYFDLFRLLQKRPVYSRTTTLLFRLGPVIALAGFMAALCLTPVGTPSLIHFPGDPILFMYLLALTRFFTIVAALDTGSAFEGMGASREALFSALAEPALAIALVALTKLGGGLSLSTMLGHHPTSVLLTISPAILLISLALFLILLVENCRIPFDDPNTHLELTMIHEVMVLDHSGPDLAIILYGASLKLWILSALLAGVILPSFTHAPMVLTIVIHLGVIFLIAIAVGVVESIAARFRLIRVPQVLFSACALSMLALVLALRYRL